MQYASDKDDPDRGQSGAVSDLHDILGDQSAFCPGLDTIWEWPDKTKRGHTD